MTWWGWLLIAVGLGLAALAVLGWLGWQVFRSAVRLGRSVGALGDAISDVR